MGTIFYRVGTTDHSGMWYNHKGEFHGAMNSPAFNMLKCNQVVMPFCKDTVGYLSAAESLEELENWFPKEDMAILEPLGFKVLTYEVTDFKWHKGNNHWLINQQSSKLIDINQLK